MTLLEGAGLFLMGAIASGINAVAGGGSFLSFPYLTVAMRIPVKVANATNSVSLWPGSLGGAFGFVNVFQKTKKTLQQLILPTIFGSLTGAYLFLATSNKAFTSAIPFLILLASLLLLAQPAVKKMTSGPHRHFPIWMGMVLQFFVALYGGFFGAGMGIMMLAVFSFTVDATIHELNSLKSWLGVVINLTCSIVFFSKGLIEVGPAVVLTIGAVVGGFVIARVSQRLDPDKLRIWIALYGFVMAAFFAYRAFVKA